jgi:hypothetical protein
VPGIFYELSGAYFLPIVELRAGTQIQVGQRLPASCMFDISFAVVNGQRVGFLFQSSFTVENGGAYLMTSLQNKGPADAYETIIKDENLVVYHFPNKGTLAIAPKVNPEIETILQEQ